MLVSRSLQSRIPRSRTRFPGRYQNRLVHEQANFSILNGGILPFGAVFIELFFILTSIWLNQFYHFFGFLFVVFYHSHYHLCGDHNRPMLFPAVQWGLFVVVEILPDVWIFCSSSFPLCNLLLLHKSGDHQASLWNSVLGIYVDCFLCLLCADRHNWLLCMRLVYKVDLFISEDRLRILDSYWCSEAKITVNCQLIWNQFCSHGCSTKKKITVWGEFLSSYLDPLLLFFPWYFNVAGVQLMMMLLEIVGLRSLYKTSFQGCVLFIKKWLRKNYTS